MEKKRKTDIGEMVMRAHYLNALDKESMASKAYSDMEKQELIALIERLNKTIDGLNDTVKRLTDQLDARSKSSQLLESQLSSLSDEVNRLRKENETYKSRERRSNQERYSTQSKKRRNLTGNDGKKTRAEEEKDWDGTGKPDSGNDGGSATVDPTSTDRSKVTEEPVKRGPRGSYRPMDAAVVEVVEGDYDKIPAGYMFRGVRYEDEYTRVSYIKCTRYEVFLVEDEFGAVHELFVPKNPDETRTPKSNTISRTHCTPEFLASLAINRYLVCTPIYRDMYRIATEKMSVCAQTVSNWLHIGARLLDCLSDSLKRLLLQDGSTLHIDETWAKVRIYTSVFKNGRYLTKYVWVLVNKMTKVVYFLYDNDENDSRGRRPISTFLEGFWGGIQTDAYAVYKFFANANGHNRHALCWAHVRTRFFDAARSAHDKDAEWFVNQINFLYEVEVENRVNNRLADEIKERRNKDDVLECLNRIFSRATRLLKDTRVHLSDMMEKALNYLINGKEKLLTYIRDGNFDIDNLAAERAIRPFTIDRKNVVLFGSEKGLRDACVYHTFLETCKMREVPFYEFLVAAFRELMHLNPDDPKVREMDFGYALPGVISLE